MPKLNGLIIALGILGLAAAPASAQAGIRLFDVSLKDALRPSGPSIASLLTNTVRPGPDDTAGAFLCTMPVFAPDSSKHEPMPIVRPDTTRERGVVYRVPCRRSSGLILPPVQVLVP
jgi:hypothetical protein